MMEAKVENFRNSALEKERYLFGMGCPTPSPDPRNGVPDRLR